MDERTLARFYSKIDKNGPVPAHAQELGRCWLWKPLGSVHGYGQFSVNGKPRLVHRVSYEHFAGPIPPQYDVDHLCRLRSCVRPGHLEAVTHAENVRRSRVWMAGASYNRGKTHCPYAHPFSGDNLRITPGGKRACRTCAREQMAERRQRERTANPRPPRARKLVCLNGHVMAETGVIRSGKRICGECARDRVRARRARLKAARKPRLTCKHGHPWTADNIYVNPVTGQRACRACHNERSLARYYTQKAEAPPKPPRETCKHGHPWTPENIYVTPGGLEKCRECAQERRRRHEAKRKAEREASRSPRPPRTHCKHGHELAGDNLYVAPDGRRFCRACSEMSKERRRSGTAERNPAKGRRPVSVCPHGHEMTPENTYIPPSGGRKCRECIRKRTREFNRTKRAAPKTEPQTAEPDGLPTLF